MAGKRPGPYGVRDDWASRMRRGQWPSPPGPSRTSPWDERDDVPDPRGRLAALSENVGEAIPRLEERARRALPVIRARVRAWSAGVGAPPYFVSTLNYGTTAAARNTIYSSSWLQLSPERGRYWFQGAAMVTGRGGIKDMEIPGAGIPSKVFDLPNADDLAFVLKGNAFLYPYNLHNFYVLRDRGEITNFELLRGRTLDRGLVVLEQFLVQSFMDSYGWPTGAEKLASLRRLSAAFNRQLSNDWLRNIVGTLFGERFDFANVDHRIRLGCEVVGRLRAQG